MNIEKIITLIVIVIIFGVIYLVSSGNKSFIELTLIGILSGLFVELFFGKKQGKKGSKDLIDLIADLFRKDNKKA